MDKKKIAEKLLELRGTRTQAEVAVACGVTKNAISMYECGERVPNDDVKLALANYFGTSVQSIFFD